MGTGGPSLPVAPARSTASAPLRHNHSHSIAPILQLQEYGGHSSAPTPRSARTLSASTAPARTPAHPRTNRSRPLAARTLCVGSVWTS
ncbi:hypothetical protein BC834DRAFT_905748 [Gloeopeniophorella convolvens]|nr:hypothetical protein BC834DRAFT_905748 [Gloeopeniophorella convolvens]